MKGTGFARFLSVLLVALLVFSMLPIRAQADDEQGTDGEETTVVTDAPASKSTAAPTPTGIPEPTATPESTVTPTPDGTPEASTGTGPTATPESTATPELTPTPASSGEPGTGEEQLEENPALFAVTFVDYDGMPIGEAQFVKAGEDAVEPAAPVRDGFTFTGWEPADTTNIQADTVFTAQYAEDTGLDEGLLDIGAGFFASAFGAALMEATAVTTTYSIQYVRGCGDNGQPKKTVTYNSSSITAPSLSDLGFGSVSGYTFLGWSTESSPAHRDTVEYAVGATLPAGNYTLYGVWKETEGAAKTYPVTYSYTGDIPAGAPDLPATEYYEAGKKNIDIAETPTVPAGYTFGGWEIKTSGVKITGGGKKFDMPAEAVTIEGSWTAATYAVTYSYTGDVPSGMTPPVEASYKVGTEVTIAGISMAPAGYTFNGWTVKTAGVTETGGKFTMPAKAVTIEGSWTAATYAVTYSYTGDVPSGMTPPVEASHKVGTAVTVAPNPVAPAGYTFGGWEKDGATITGSFTMPAKNVQLTGEWTAATYNVIYSYTGDVPLGMPDPAAESYKVGTAVTAVKPTVPGGYTFNGWTTTDATITDDGKFTMPAKNVQLTGSWTVAEYTVAYSYTGHVPFGAPEPPAPVKYKSGDTVTIADKPTLGLYRFNGWTVATSGVTVNDGQFTMPAEEVKIEGSWTFTGKYTITTSVTGGTITPTDEVWVGFSKTINYSPNPGYHLVSVVVDDEDVTAWWNRSRYTFWLVHSNHTIVVTYESNSSYELTIQYVYADGLEAKLPVTRTVKCGETYEVASPTIADYTADQLTVKGIMPDHDLTIKVVYTANTFKIETSVTDGTITATDNAVPYGSEKTIGYSPKTGYHLVSVLVDGTIDVTETNPSSYTFSNVTAHHTITVVYEINKYTVTFKPGDHAAAGTDEVTVKDIPHGTRWDAAGITVPAFIVGGYYNWADWSPALPSNETLITSDLTFTGQWTEMPTVTVTGKSESRAYNGTTQTLTGIESIVASDGADTSGWATRFGFSATGSLKDVGSANVVVGGPSTVEVVSGTSYQVIKVNGTLAINPAPVTITADNASKYVGGADPTPFTATVTSGTIYHGDFTYDVNRSNVGVEAAGIYTDVLTVNHTAGANYNVTTVNGTLTISKRPTTTTVSATPASGIPGSALTISGRVADASGAAAYAPGFSGSVTITFDGHTYTAVPVASDGTFTLSDVTARPAHVGTGGYPVTADYLGDDAFETSSGSATVTVVGRPITITADNASKYIGAADPAFTAGVTSGTYYGDFAYGVTRPGLGTDEAVGTYTRALVVAPDTADPDYNDYAVTLVPGDFTINKRPTTTTVTAAPASGIPGSALTIGGSVADTSGAPGAPGFSGNVTITFNSHTYTVPVAANGTFTLSAVTTRPMHTGSFTVTANYLGNETAFIGSSDTATVTVTAGTATLTIRFLLQGVGTRLATPYTRTFNVGDRFSVSDLTDRLIGGYTRVSVSGATSGTITGNRTIIVYYEEVSTPTPTPAATPTPTPTAGTPTPTPTTAAVPAEVINPEPPLAGPGRSWALANLIMTVLTATWSGYMLLRYFGKRRGRGAAVKAVGGIGRQNLIRLLSLIPGIGGVIAFILTQDVRSPMAFTDQWTLLMAAIFLVQGGMAALAARSHGEEPGNA